MIDGVDTLVRGRSAGKDGHGELDWSESCAFFVEGRPEGAMGRAVKARPALGRDVVRALHVIAKRSKLAKSSFRSTVTDITEMFLCFDHLEAVTPFKFTGGAADVAGQPWLFFTEWLEAKREGQKRYLIYWNCKRVLGSGPIDVRGSI